MKIDQSLKERQLLGRMRQLKKIDSLLNFSSNDYLHLSHHPELFNRASEYALKYGVGTGSSRLICGNFEIHESLEKKIADLYGREEALLFPSGYQANVSTIPALISRDWKVFADRECHHSLLQGVRLSQARLNRYPHGDLMALECLLKQQELAAPKLIMTESMFSMSGDVSDIERLRDLSQKYQAILYVDEAHAFGILGKSGLGLTAGIEGVDITMVGFGKGGGCSGAFIACSKRMKEYLIQTCGGFIYTTSISPLMVGCMEAALNLIPYMDQEKRRVLENANQVRVKLREMGWNVGGDGSPIVPVLFDEEEMAQFYSHELEKKGILAVAIRPPTVPTKTSRIRLSLSSVHTEKEIGYLLKSFLQLTALSIPMPASESELPVPVPELPVPVPVPVPELPVPVPVPEKKVMISHCLFATREKKFGYSSGTHAGTGTGTENSGVEWILQHGWGFDSTFWKEWLNKIPKSIFLVLQDRGYFGEPKLSANFSSECNRRVLVCHSFGLHLVSPKLIEEADVLVVISGFLDFHGEDHTSPLVVQRMINQFKTDPGNVLKKFYRNCGLENYFLKQINSELLLHDLEMLNRSVLDLSLFDKRLVIIHGSEDRIVPVERSKQFLSGQTHHVLLTGLGHAVPILKPEKCIQEILKVS